MTTPDSLSPSAAPTKYWLIELGQPERHVPTVWYKPSKKILQWTENANEALRFKSREEAEQFVTEHSSYVGDPLGRVTEHVFMNRPPSVTEEDLEWIYVAYLRLRDASTTASDKRTPTALREVLVKNGYQFND